MALEPLLPDTCAWIEFFRGGESPMAQALERQLLHGEVSTCGVILYELVQGIKSGKEERVVVDALQGVKHIEVSAPLWIKAGRLSAELRKKGHTLPMSDLIIAALAVEHRLTVLTVDSHFNLIPGLKLANG